MGFLSDIVKNIKLVGIMNRAGRYSTTWNFEDLEATYQGQKELFTLVLNDADLVGIMNEYGADQLSIEDIYKSMLKHGGAMWVAGGFLPAAALATKPTLRYLLTHYRRTPPLSEGEWKSLLVTLLTYYESGRSGPVQSSGLT